MFPNLPGLLFFKGSRKPIKRPIYAFEVHSATLKLTLKFALNWDGQLLMEAFNGHLSCLLSRRPKVGTRILTGHKGRSFVRMLCTR